MNNTSSVERINISFFGAVNSGKSSLMNAITAQEISIVSDIKGTTTDPVRKAVELLPIGAVMLYDTAGFDDESPASELRMKKTKEILRITDLAVLVTDITSEMSNSDNDMLEAFKQQGIPYIIVHSKADLNQQKKIYPYGEAAVSSKTGSGIEELKELICSVYLKSLDENKPLYKNVTDGLAAHKSVVILVTPIDASAPKGRLILPQVQTIRSLLDSFAVTMTVQPSELSTALEILCRKPDLVITDSQAFSYVKDIVPNDVPLTSFSILFARYKGMLPQVLEGIRSLKYVNDGECILISEGCTHHRQCGDIARDKLPLWIENFTKKKLNFEFTSGGTFPEDLRKYALIVHCGGCMLSSREIDYRRRLAKSQGIPFTNYGILISAINGMLERSIRFIQK
ncbi:MAG: [FeFe] hydrogenase H-cluster maturation GTPase HydF [Ruminococcus sp.]|nr:[FeFe] hydrogenase H-cluster maturation GTPase HydF [Ruminococcus sp.]